MSGPQRVRADQQAPDDVDGSLPAGVVTIIFIFAVPAGIGWLWLMHIAGQGRMPW